MRAFKQMSSFSFTPCFAPACGSIMQLKPADAQMKDEVQCTFENKVYY